MNMNEKYFTGLYSFIQRLKLECDKHFILYIMNNNV